MKNNRIEVRNLKEAMDAYFHTLGDVGKALKVALAQRETVDDYAPILVDSANGFDVDASEVAAASARLGSFRSNFRKNGMAKVGDAYVGTPEGFRTLILAERRNKTLKDAKSRPTPLARLRYYVRRMARQTYHEAEHAAETAGKNRWKDSEEVTRICIQTKAREMEYRWAVSLINKTKDMSEVRQAVLDRGQHHKAKLEQLDKHHRRMKDDGTYASQFDFGGMEDPDPDNYEQPRTTGRIESLREIHSFIKSNAKESMA